MMEDYEEDFDDEYFYGPDDENIDELPAILQPMPEPELDAIHKVGREKHRGPLGRMYFCRERLERMSHIEIARELQKVIDVMAEMGWDIVNFLHFLSWNLDIPPDLMHELSVIK